jgi:hypothetical protein
MSSRKPSTSEKAPIVTKLFVDAKSSRPSTGSSSAPKSTKKSTVPNFVTKLAIDEEEEPEEEARPLPKRPKAEKLSSYKPSESAKPPATKTSVPKPVVTKLSVDVTSKKPKPDPAPSEPKKSAVSKIFGFGKSEKEDKQPAVATKLKVDVAPKKPSPAQERPAAPIKAPIFVPPKKATPAPKPEPAKLIAAPTKLQADVIPKKVVPAQTRPTAPIKAPVFVPPPKPKPEPVAAKSVKAPAKVGATPKKPTAAPIEPKESTSSKIFGFGKSTKNDKQASKLQVDATSKKATPSLAATRPTVPIKAPVFVPPPKKPTAAPAQTRPTAPIKAPVFVPPTKPAKAGPSTAAPDKSKKPSPASYVPPAPSMKSKAPAGTASTFKTPDDQVMASRQTQIAKMSPAERKQQEKWAQQQLVSNAGTGACVAGYSWNRVDDYWDGLLIGGYRCQGGAHMVTDELLAEGRGGFYNIVPDGRDHILGWLGPCYSAREVDEKFERLERIIDHGHRFGFIHPPDMEWCENNSLKGADKYYQNN